MNSIYQCVLKLTSSFIILISIQFSSVQFIHSVVSDSLWPHEPQQARPPCPSPTPRVHPNPCPSCQWCHPTVSSSVVPFSSCPQSVPASGSFPMSQLFTSGGQSIGVSASASVLPMTLDLYVMEMASFLKPREPTSARFKLFFGSFHTFLNLNRLKGSRNLFRIRFWFKKLLLLVWFSIQATQIFSTSVGMEYFAFLPFCVFVGVAFFISFKNFSFGFTTWLFVAGGPCFLDANKMPWSRWIDE